MCGSAFEFNPSAKPGLFCANCVEQEQWQIPPGLSGADDPARSGGKIEATGETCGSTCRRRRCALEDERATLCSRECHRKWLSESFTGEGHPNWKGGGLEPYGKGRRRPKLDTLARDNHACVICGRSRDDLGRNPDVHHMVPVRHFVEAPVDDETDAHGPSNLVTLCVSCHQRSDFGSLSKAALKRLVGILD